MTVFAFWFDRNKELNYPFLGTRVIRWSRFFKMIFTTRVNSYIGTTIVVPNTYWFLEAIPYQNFLPQPLASVSIYVLYWCMIACWLYTKLCIQQYIAFIQIKDSTARPRTQSRNMVSFISSSFLATHNSG